MRILEPHHFRGAGSKKKKLSSKRRFALFGVLLGVAVIVGYVLFGQKVSAPTSHTESSSQPPRPKVQSQTLKTFTPDEFKKAYNAHVYPNTETITVPPGITGNEQADARIRKIAEARGYKLTALPVASIVKTGEPGLEGDDLMQPNALIAWQQLKDAATKDGIKLKMTSAYRSIDYQRQLFLTRMQATGVNVGRILEGYADDEIETVLSRAALPGYSRHHTGYTMDLSCNGVGLEAFKGTTCYQWLSKNNYENVKKFGWVPSYPEGVSGTGPEPESWEFVWIGTLSTYQ